MTKPLADAWPKTLSQWIRSCFEFMAGWILIPVYGLAALFSFGFSEFAGETAFTAPRILIAYVVFSVMPWLAATLIVRACSPRAWQIPVAWLALALCTVPYLYPWHPRMQFIGRFNSIEIGTTESDLRQRLRPYLDVLKTTDGATRSHLTFYWDDNAYDSDWACFDLLDGRVVYKGFFPD